MKKIYLLISMCFAYSLFIYADHIEIDDIPFDLVEIDKYITIDESLVVDPWDDFKNSENYKKYIGCINHMPSVLNNYYNQDNAFEVTMEIKSQGTATCTFGRCGTAIMGTHYPWIIRKYTLKPKIAGDYNFSVQIDLYSHPDDDTDWINCAKVRYKVHIYSPPIIFQDDKVKNICVANWDTNGDGDLSEFEASIVTDIGTTFKGSEIDSFDEFAYFTGLTTIPEDAFYNCKSLTSIIIPENVTKIDCGAFNFCESLTSITIPKSVKYIMLDHPFWHCSGLTSIIVEEGNTNYDSRNNCNAIIRTGDNRLLVGCQNTVIPGSVTSIEDRAFEGCENLTSIVIPKSVTNIGFSAFFGCKSLTSIIIPSSVSSIETTAFSNCPGITSIKVEQGNSSYDSRDNCNAIIESSSNTLIAGCKNTIIPNSVTRLEASAFSGCEGLTSITIPNSVTSIGDYAFNGCSGLTSVMLGRGVTSIGEMAFGTYGTLKDFYCSAEKVPNTSSDAFTGIYFIERSTLHVPAGSISAYRTTAPWSNFGKIVSIDNNPKINYADAGDKALCVANWDTNGDGELSTAEAAAVTDFGTVFKGNTRISSFNELQYFTGLTSIGNEAFRGCSGLTSVTIPNTVTSINDGAFLWCSGLNSITIPNSVTSIGDNVFSGCDGLISVTLNCSSIGSWFAGNSSITEIILGDDVTSIDNSAFRGCSSLNSITIPNSVTTIGESAFYYCESLTSVIIGKGVTSINFCTFAWCSSLTSITIPNSVTSIDDSAFEGCEGLTSITIPNSVTSIGEFTFCYCLNLTSVTIPNSVISIGYGAFYGCSGLTSIIIPDGVTSIGSEAFYNCSGLTSITIPNGVTSIESSVFRNCSSLTTVIIPESVTSISYYAFSGCNALTDVFCLAEDIPSTTSSAFTTSLISSATLHVPASSVDLYAATSPWSGFGTIVALSDEDGIREIKNESLTPALSKGEGVWYSFDGKKLSNPQKGTNIIRYSDGTTRKVMRR